MKKYISLLLGLLLSIAVFAQEKPVKIVFDVTSNNPKTQESAIRHVKMMSQAYPDSQFEVVMYGGSIDMALADKSTVSKDIQELSKSKNVAFKVCEGTMKRHNIDATALVPGILTVPDGILELVQRQSEGWGYIKEGGN
ncbi:DsrE family protein [Robertkochia solimangrovi]|uniref:DsrE family protein n=1 Tax=Robertkochia solimangrovi TaxID=2213046 RepID=UPI001180F3F4|nr:DsrE family protein [Robertkochia solimangrovi]TRZ46259.1 hypothetical protein DMZ48_03105 [Robertkochia solimangrovi]